MNALRSGAALGALAAVLLAGCAAEPASAPNVDESADVSMPGVGEDYLCWQTPVAREAFDSRTPLSDLSPPASAALAEAIWDDGSPLVIGHEDEWWVGSESAEEVVILRELSEEDVQDTDVVLTDMVGAGHELIAIQFIDDASNWEPGWHVMASTRCALTVDLGELSVPRVQLDPSMPPTPDSTVIHLLVTEMQCNSGEGAEGRVELVNVDEGAERVSVVLGVKPRDDVTVVTCPGNPRTSFALTLSEPLGDRTIFDAALATPRPIEPPALPGY